MKLSLVLATALAVAATAPEKADLKDVTRHADKYIGKTIAVDGEVMDVLGPHLFVVDAPRWFHLFGGMVVVVPEPFAAIVRRDAPIHVTGTVEKVVLAEARRRWAFLSDPAIEVDLFEKPVIVASEVTTIAPSVVSLRFQPGQPTAGSRGDTTIKDAGTIAKAGDSSMAGRHVDLSGTVSRTVGEGFWLKTMSGDEVFVLPASKTSVRPSQSVAVQGTLLESPRRSSGQAAPATKQPTYVYADKVTPK
ncbi:MAG TPA: hypothetical protein VG871_14175 [Vicinamibacterales bacterium]|nr:hypothetical protein [Vicinamibacterales bacterium]